MKNALRFFALIVLFTILLSRSVFAGEKVYFYHNDAAGTAMAITDQQGDVVWRKDYKPFGEEQSTTGTIENNRQFIGKELDVETGLIYINHRYYSPELGRFITPDPIGPVNPWNSKTNYEMLLNPQRLNPYAYGLNNPYRYVDRDGNWAEDVHSGIGNFKYGTYIWASQAGFSDKDAKTIAKGNNATDFGPGTSFMPFLTGGDQSRHFNKQYVSIGSDSRDFWAEWELQKATEFAKKGNMEAALGHLGKGLHSLQDKYAHRDWDTGFWGAEEHPGWYDDWSDNRNKAAAENTRKATLDYLRRFKESF